VLLIDQSASMAVTYSDRTLFDRAQEAAAKVIKELPDGSVAHLGYFDAQGVATSKPIINRTREPGFGGTDYTVALAWARDVLVASKRKQRKLYLFTDLQRTGLRGKPFEGTPIDVDVEIVEIGKAVVSNLAVESVETSEPLLRGGQPIVVTANVFNAGPLPVRDVSVRLALESDSGKLPEQLQKVTIAPGTRQSVEFSPPIKTPGIYHGSVEVVVEDDFPLDNRRWLAIDARLPDRVLLVDGKPANSVYANETYYLEAALRLRLPRKGGSITPYDPERLAWGSATTLPELRPYRLVVLCNVASIADTDLLRLRSFVTDGGSLLIFTGKNVQPAGYQTFERLGLLPATVGEIAGPGLFRFDAWEKDHPVFRPFADPQEGDLRRLIFHHLTRLKPVTGSKVLAFTQDKEPLLVESRVGRGAILLFASTADRDWGSWPQSRLYVPLIHQLAGYLTERLPENERVQQAQAGPGRDNPPGIHAAEGRVTARNLDATESDLERVTGEKFRQTYHLPELSAAARKARAAASVTAPADNERPGELWTYVVWALLLVLVAELFVANRTHA